MKVAYVINEYPKVTHTFVRTEIAAVERAGVAVERVAIRRAATPVVDAADRHEASRTHVVLDVGTIGLLSALAIALATRPRRFARAVARAVRIGWGSERSVLLHLAYLIEACVLLRWTQKHRVDHVHATFGHNPAAVALLCHALGGPPFSFTAHGPEEIDRAVALRIVDKINEAAFVVAVSAIGQRQLRQMCTPEAAQRIHVVRCGIDARFSQHRATPIAPARRLVFVGRLCDEKAPLVLIDALAQVNASDEPCDLVMVGDGPLRDAVVARVAALRLGQQVTLVGWGTPDDVKDHILAARALVLPSVAEGLPIVLMEAFALGRPVICTPVGGVTELVENGVSGFVVAPGSVEALAAAMRTVLNTPPAELEKMARHGAARVAQQHDTNDAGRALATLFAATARGAVGVS